MQYTGSSYAWKMIESFRHLIRPRREAPPIVEYFPSQGRLHTMTPDMAQERIYNPLFKGLARMFERLWPLQRGRIQLYLIYTVATVFILFLLEGRSARLLAPKDDGVAKQVSESTLRDFPIESAARDGGDHHR